MHNEFTLPHEVFENNQFKELSSRAQLLYCYLGKLRNRYGNNEGWFWRSIPLLSKDMGKSERYIRYAKQELIDKGFLSIARGKYKTMKRRAPDWYKLEGYADEESL